MRLLGLSTRITLRILIGCAWFVALIILSGLWWISHLLAVVVLTLGLIQNVWIKIERYQVGIKNLPWQFYGYKIAMISDLHISKYTSLKHLRKIMKKINLEDVDLVVVVGDIVDGDSSFMNKFILASNSIREKTPVVAVLGDHDIYAEPDIIQSYLRHSRTRLLINQGFELKSGDASLWLAGVGDYAANAIPEYKNEFGPNFLEAMLNKPTGMPSILLCHQPNGYNTTINYDVDLTLSGHTHGGQIGVKKWGITLAGWFTQLDMGWFWDINPKSKKRCELFVSTGLGSFGMLPRFGIRPEIVIFRLGKKTK